MNNICMKCRKRSTCKYAHKTWKGITLYVKDHCAMKFSEDCKKIADDNFRQVVDRLRNIDSEAVTGILKQAENILIVADDIGG